MSIDLKGFRLLWLGKQALGNPFNNATVMGNKLSHWDFPLNCRLWWEWVWINSVYMATLVSRYERTGLRETRNVVHLNCRAEYNLSTTRQRKCFWTQLRLEREDWAALAQMWQQYIIFGKYNERNNRYILNWLL